MYYLTELEKVTCTPLFIVLCQGNPLLVVTFLTYLHNKKLDFCSFDLTASFGTVCSIPMHLYSYMSVLSYSSLFRPAYSFMFLKLLSALGSKPVSSLLSYLYSTDIVLYRSLCLVLLWQILQCRHVVWPVRVAVKQIAYSGYITEVFALSVTQFPVSLTSLRPWGRCCLQTIQKATGTTLTVFG